jgi:D-glycero-alpha-D-manno-heptose 1-phosphate guanylyltransferase
MQALILAGGEGTRLRSVLGENLNKPMAPIAQKPFLEYLVMRLHKQGIDDIILCVGYKAALIESYFGRGDQWGVQLKYSHETELLGTGGAVKLAEDLLHGNEFMVLNGDSYFDIDLSDLAHFHHKVGADATLALAQVSNAQRFGAVRLNDEHRIIGFTEKDDEVRPGLINGGVYALARDVLRLIPTGQLCSLERDVFPLLTARKLYGRPYEGFFIDIGVPADYERLQADPSPLFAASGDRRQTAW